MGGQFENEFAEALKISKGYYRAIVPELASEIIEHRDDFVNPFLGGEAEMVIEKYGRRLQDLCRVYTDVSFFGEVIHKEKIAQLKEDEFLCFSCRNIVRKEEHKCSKCGWTWK